MSETDPMLSKVRKLLAMAEDPACTEAEAEAFTARATRLIADHGIDEALLALGDPSRGVVGDRVFDLDPPYAQEKGELASAIALGLRCRAVLRQQRTCDEHYREHSDFSLHTFGHEADLRAVEVLFTSLLLQGTRDLTRTRVPRGEHAAAFRRTWWLGFAAAIGHRLIEVERGAAAEAEERFAARGTSTALVLAGREQQADAALRGAYPSATRGRQRQLSGGGSRHGWASGQRADLGGERLGAAARGEIA